MRRLLSYDGAAQLCEPSSYSERNGSNWTQRPSAGHTYRILLRVAWRDVGVAASVFIIANGVPAIAAKLVYFAWTFILCCLARTGRTAGIDALSDLDSSGTVHDCVWQDEVIRRFPCPRKPYRRLKTSGTTATAVPADERMPINWLEWSAIVP